MPDMSETDMEQIQKDLKYALSPKGKAEAAAAAITRAESRLKMVQDIEEFAAEGNGRSLVIIVRGLFRNIESGHNDGLSGEVLSSLCGRHGVSIGEIREAAYSSDPMNDVLKLLR